MDQIELIYSDPHMFLHDEANIYVMDDFGTAIKVPSSLWYGNHPSMESTHE